MLIIWDLGPCFVKDIMIRIPSPKPHYNTISSLVRSLEEKDYVTHRVYGNTHQYFPLVDREDYKIQTLQKVVNNFFGNSYCSMVSYFVEKQKISPEELEDLMQEIQKGKQNE